MHRPTVPSVLSGNAPSEKFAVIYVSFFCHALARISDGMTFLDDETIKYYIPNRQAQREKAAPEIGIFRPSSFAFKVLPTCSLT